MQNNPFFDDLAKLATSAGSTVLEWRKEVEKSVQGQMDKWASKMNLVSREEFEAVRDMAQKARLDNEVLQKRVDALEGGTVTPAKATKATPTPRKKTGSATKKTASAEAAATSKDKK